jgi:hypothetical protein
VALRRPLGPALADPSPAFQIALQIPQIGGCDCPAEVATVADMDKPVQWMTLQELRDELERTRPAWEAEVADWMASLPTAHSRRWTRTRTVTDGRERLAAAAE